MTYSQFDSFTIEEAKRIGAKFLTKCIYNTGYDITVGKAYVITIKPRILPMSPLCSFVDDSGKMCEGHLSRFEKLNAIDDEVTEV